MDIIPRASAGTYKSGTIRTETWTVAGSPYWIEGNVTVSEGEILTIEPGVEVRYNKDHDGLI